MQRLHGITQNRYYWKFKRAGSLAVVNTFVQIDALQLDSPQAHQMMKDVQHQQDIDGVCDCGLPLEKSSLPRGWSIHLSQDKDTFGEVSFRDVQEWAFSYSNSRSRTTSCPVPFPRDSRGNSHSDANLFGILLRFTVDRGRGTMVGRPSFNWKVTRSSHRGAALLENNEASAKLTTANGGTFTSRSARLSSQSCYSALDQWLTCFNVIGYWHWLSSK